MIPSATLPLRCVKCNAEVEELTRLRLMWRPAWVFTFLLTICLLGLIGLLLYLLISLLTRRIVIVYVGVCSHHRRRRIHAMWATGLILAAAVALAFLAISYESGPLGIVFSLTILAAIPVWLIWGPIVRPTRIDKHFIWLAGVNELFVTNLPELGPVADLPGRY
jgi:hypothetical protein